MTMLDADKLFFVGVTPPTGDYEDLDNKPAIDGVELHSDTTKADLGLDTVFVYKGQVNTYNDLPKTGNNTGDTWNVKDTGENYCWNGIGWDCLSGASTVYYNNNTLQSGGYNITIDADKNTLSNIETDNFKSGVIQTTLRSTTSAKDTSVATEKAVRTALDTGIKSVTDVIDTYGDIVTHNASEFATAEQGAKADTAVQPSALSGYVPTSRTINGKPLTTNITLTSDDVLPNQAGQSGKYLTTDGTVVSWGNINALQNTATGYYSLTVGGRPAVSQYCVNIGVISSVNASNCVCLGYGASVNSQGGVAIGYGNSVGYNSDNACVLGRSSSASGYSSIQLGFMGQNNDAGTLKVSLGTSYATVRNYELLNSSGKIPDDRITKQTTLSSSSTDNQVPSAKCVYDLVGNIESLLATI